MNSITINELFDLSKATNSAAIFTGHTYPWEILPLIKEYTLVTGTSLNLADYNLIGENVWVHDNVSIAPTATINGPCIIAEGTEIRPGAFIRGSVIIGKNCVIGNSTEIKNAIIFDDVQVPHYNYVGDSILGHHAHMGAGSITSNVKADKTNVVIKGNGIMAETGLRKCGAFLGDFADIGCNSVLNPGTVIGRKTNVYPLSCVRGVVPAASIYKKAGEIVLKR